MIAAASTPQPLGLAGRDSSKFDAFSVYGFDIMLTDDFKPIVIETNFSPDCTRACQVRNSFQKIGYDEQSVITLIRIYSMILNSSIIFFQLLMQDLVTLKRVWRHSQYCKLDKSI